MSKGLGFTRNIPDDFHGFFVVADAQIDENIDDFHDLLQQTTRWNQKCDFLEENPQQQKTPFWISPLFSGKVTFVIEREKRRTFYRCKLNEAFFAKVSTRGEWSFKLRSLAAHANAWLPREPLNQDMDAQHARMAVIHDACAPPTAATPRTSLVNSKGSNGAADTAVQSVEGMARTLRLDLLSRTNVAVGSDLPTTSWRVRHAAWLLSHFQAGTADGKTAYARQFEKTLRVTCAAFC